MPGMGGQQQNQAVIFLCVVSFALQKMTGEPQISSRCSETRSQNSHREWYFQKHHCSQLQNCFKHIETHKAVGRCLPQLSSRKNDFSLCHIWCLIFNFKPVNMLKQIWSSLIPLYVEGYGN